MFLYVIISSSSINFCKFYVFAIVYVSVLSIMLVLEMENLSVKRENTIIVHWMVFAITSCFYNFACQIKTGFYTNDDDGHAIQIYEI